MEEVSGFIFQVCHIITALEKKKKIKTNSLTQTARLTVALGLFLSFYLAVTRVEYLGQPFERKLLNILMATTNTLSYFYIHIY